jgi:hypothetical protein
MPMRRSSTPVARGSAVETGVAGNAPRMRIGIDIVCHAADVDTNFDDMLELAEPLGDARGCDRSEIADVVERACTRAPSAVAAVSGERVGGE